MAELKKKARNKVSAEARAGQAVTAGRISKRKQGKIDKKADTVPKTD